MKKDSFGKWYEKKNYKKMGRYINFFSHRYSFNASLVLICIFLLTYFVIDIESWNQTILHCVLQFLKPRKFSMSQIFIHISIATAMQMLSRWMILNLSKALKIWNIFDTRMEECLALCYLLKFSVCQLSSSTSAARIWPPLTIGLPYCFPLIPFQKYF